MGRQPRIEEDFESAEHKANNSFYSPNVDKYVRAYFYSDVYSGKDSEIVNQRLLNELIANLEKDFSEMSYEDYISPRPSYANIELQYTSKDGKDPTRGDGRSYMNFSLPAGAQNTINWLKANGYYFELTADMVEWVDIYAPNHELEEYGKPSTRVATKEYRSFDRERKLLMQITDKDEINKILQNYDRFSINYGSAYEINIAYRPKIANGVVLEKDGFEDYYYIYGYLNGTLDFL